MKVNYKTYPVLKKLEDGKLGKIGVSEYDIDFSVSPAIGVLSDVFKREVNNFKNITFLSSEFADAANKARPKLSELYNDISKNNSIEFSVNGTFILNNQVFFISHVINEKSNIGAGAKSYKTCFFLFHRSGVPMAFYIDDDKGFLGWASHYYDEWSKGDLSKFLAEFVTRTIIISMFKSYAQVETKHVKRNTRVRHMNDICQNDTNLDITYLTSKWFTNLVRSEGFKVSGHFRLQPKKVNGEWTKELIWIEPYEKHGYTSRAQILNQ